MRLQPFGLERYFARHEFSVRHNLAASDVQGLALTELLALADEETAALWSRLTLGYTESAGLPLLRQEIADLDDLDVDDVIVCAGAEEAIFLTMHALVEPGDHAVVVWPAYQSLHEVARSIGAAVSLVELRHEEGWQLDVAEVQSAMRPETRVVAINFPHNPTGAQLPQAELLALVALCEARGITLLSDEVYRFLEHDPRDMLPAAASLGERSASIGVMSKSFALAGLRIGWIATRDAALRERVAALKDYTTICSAAPSEVLALMALRARATILERSRTIVQANMVKFGELVGRHADHMEWVPPRAGAVAFPRLRDAEADLEGWIDQLIASEGVLLLPGTLFGSPGPHFRIGLGRTDGLAALECLDKNVRHSLCDPMGA
ncbi:MAG: aminotransferase class I/II-fold pyridoxal phosphate-dependent enzyme [Gemmatimonadaceae bacterium]|nr:aminotransferase class I/II-fold pyridoxal phosphate-dependent enzyme [Gemmatimonadaceae bacterium]